jgi:peptidoglycan/LPS O-acetylase OafA/YrhL
MAEGVLDWRPVIASPQAVPMLGHRPALDGLRGLALVMVLITHTAPPIVWGGFIALEIFFVLSAFLITTLILEEYRQSGTVVLYRFYLRRALRLVPALLVMLATVWVITLVSGRQDDLSRLKYDTATILGYCHNWRLALAPGGWQTFTFQLSPCWSLAVEEQFYLLWPLVFTALLNWRMRRRWIIALLVTAVIVPSLLRAGQWRGRESFEWLYFSTFARADGVAMGCLLAVLRFWWPFAWGPRADRALFAAAWVAVAALGYHFFMFSMWDAWMYQGGFDVVNLAAMVLIGALMRNPPVLSDLLAMPPLRWLGRISYGSYLWNMFVFCLVVHETPFLVTPHANPKLHVPVLLQPWLIWTGTLLAGALSWYVVERPFLRLKDRLGPVTPPLPTAPEYLRSAVAASGR